MINTEVLNKYFIWEEKNLTEPKNNCLNNKESVHCDTTTEIKNDSTKKDWRDITDPKLRRKMRMREYNKVYYKSNTDSLKSYQKYYYKDPINTDKVRIRMKGYYESNKDKIKSKSRVYRKNNSHRRKERYKTDIQYRLSESLRRRIRSALCDDWKSGSAVRDLGCSILELKIYLESKFQTGMSWDNWSVNGWHIDHIKPLASFDLTDRKQFLEACHYTNLQPLWAKDNLVKGAKTQSDDK